MCLKLLCICRYENRSYRSQILCFIFEQKSLLRNYIFAHIFDIHQLNTIFIHVAPPFISHIALPWTAISRKRSLVTSNSFILKKCHKLSYSLRQCFPKSGPRTTWSARLAQVVGEMQYKLIICASRST
jgi:hypothetical protein